MDFHILTKKQAECLKQIHGRTSVSSFFEPLHTMRELESLELIRRFRDGQFDSGFGYELTSAAMALSPFECGTKYSFVNGGGTIWIHERPVAATPEKLAELQREVKRLNQSNKNLGDAFQRLESDNGILRNEIAHMEKVRASLQRQRNDALNARDQANDNLDSMKKSHYRLSQDLREKETVISRLQNTIEDYIQNNKVDRAVIRELQKSSTTRWLEIGLSEFGQEGLYVFRNQRDTVSPKYVVGSFHGMYVRDLDGKPINLNVYTHGLLLEAK